MDAIAMTEAEIKRETDCIKFLEKRITKHDNEGNVALRVARMEDMERSIRTAQRLKERTRLYAIAADLARAGVLAKVVKRYAHQS